jgi:hypothetical protein
MSDYRIDVVMEANPDRALHREHFTARSTDTAIRKASRIVAAHATDRPDRYGDLYVRDGTTADYVATIELPA